MTTTATGTGSNRAQRATLCAWVNKSSEHNDNRYNGWCNGHRVLVALACLSSWTSAIVAQNTPSDSAWMAGTVTVVPGPDYDAGWLHRFFFGDHYRELWTREMRVPILSLDRFAGGVEPICRGGGFQTISLRFSSNDGPQYVFRSVDKDPTAKLPLMLRETFIADVLQDQISSHHPAGALVVAPLLEAAGVLHAEPRLALMPDHQALGPFRSTYAGVLGLMEERPTDGPEGSPGFGQSSQISGTERVWRDIEESPENRVDARSFLRARLMDMFVGDWDRHYDQWRWARYPAPHGFDWRPIPRDRDQAFAKLDGLILSLARLNIRELVSFGDSYGSIFGLTWTGRSVDRRFLAGLSESAWDSVVADLQERLTDNVIENAVRRLPREVYDTEGPELVAALKLRRTNMPDAAAEFYQLLATYTDIRATDEDEIAEITRLEDGRLSVRISLRNGGAVVSEPHYERTFHPSETEEIRLYLQGGDDRAVVRGGPQSQMMVRVVGGGGDDLFADSSRGDGRIRTRFYDSRGQNEFQRTLNTSFNRNQFQPPPVPTVDAVERPFGACGDSLPETAPRDLALPFRDWGGRSVPLPWVSYQPDLGAFLGAGTMKIKYGFRRAPYQSKQSFRVGFATGPRRFRAEYEGDFRGVAAGVGADVKLRYSGIDNIRYHGLGNETVLDQPTPVYDVTIQQIDLAPSLVFHISPSTALSVGPRFKYARTALEAGTVVDQTQPLGVDGLSQFGAHISFSFDNRNEIVAATKGTMLYLSGFGSLGARTDGIKFAGVSGEARTYFTAANVPMRPTLALRAGGKKLWGTYAYYDAAYLGGASNLRGFAEQRFAGDAAVFGNAELRLFLTRYRILLPGEFGIFGLADVGRVFLAGETSNRWHAAGGGGIWFAFVDRSATVSVAIAQSREQRGFYFTLGFAF